MSRYKAYQEYKDSGVDWLGGAPSHWTSTAIKYGYEITLGKMLQKEANSPTDEFKPYLKAINIQISGVSILNVEEMWFSISELRSLRLKKGDLLISEGGDVGRSAIWNDELPECYIQNAINRARPYKKHSSKFLYYWMVMLKESSYIDVLCNKATIAHYTVDKLESSPLFLLPENEAETIAAFLDHETAKIDALIEKQQRLIELLKEKRQAVISHAVTKGLNPNAPMKDSGVEWLGEVPAHWHSRQLKYLCSYNDEVLSETVGDDFEIEYVDIGSVSAIDGISGTETLLFGDAPSRARRIVRDGDILISTVRTYLEAIASVQAPPNNLIASTGFAVIRPNAFLHKGYAAYCLRASGFIKEVVARSVGVSYPAINASDLVNIKTPEPSPTEQEKIAAFLDHQTAKIDALIEKQLRLIELAQERRTALISAAVTGKIDVRDWQAAA